MQTESLIEAEQVHTRVDVKSVSNKDRHLSFVLRFKHQWSYPLQRSFNQLSFHISQAFYSNEKSHGHSPHQGVLGPRPSLTSATKWLMDS